MRNKKPLEILRNMREERIKRSEESNANIKRLLKERNEASSARSHS